MVEDPALLRGGTLTRRATLTNLFPDFIDKESTVRLLLVLDSDMERAPGEHPRQDSRQRSSARMRR